MSWNRLVKDVILHDFGRNAERVVEALIANEGSTTRDQIRTHTGLKDAVVKKSLTVLIQQRIIRHERAKVKGNTKNSSSKTGFATPAPPVRWNYVLQHHEARYRLLGPRYILHCKHIWGQEGEVVAETMFQHGQLTGPQLLELCLKKLPGLVDGSSQEGMKEQIKMTQNVKSNIKLLIADGYFMEVPRIDQEGAPIVKNALENVRHKRRKLEESEEPLFNDQDTVYAFNHSRFLFDLRNQEITEFVQQRVNPSAAAVVGLVLKGYPHDTRQPVKALSTGSMLGLCARSEHAPKLSRSLLESYIDEICSENCNILTELEDGFTINIRGIFNSLQAEHIQAIVSDRIEPLAGRIYRLLAIYKRLEEKQVAEFATAPLKDVRRVLHALYQNKFASMQEIPRAGNADRNPTRQFYLWGVPAESVRKMLVEQFMGVWCKLRARLKVESDKVKHIHDKVDASDQLSKEDELEYKKWKKGNDRLHHSLNQLDKLMLIFHDYCDPPHLAYSATKV